MQDEDRLIVLETKIAFQEDLLQVLNDTVVKQHARLNELEQRYQELAQRMTNLSLAPDSTSDPDERPPHY